MRYFRLALKQIFEHPSEEEKEKEKTRKENVDNVTPCTLRTLLSVMLSVYLDSYLACADHPDRSDMCITRTPTYS